LDVMRWGLVPLWAKDIKVGFANINAKAADHHHVRHWWENLSRTTNSRTPLPLYSSTTAIEEFGRPDLRPSLASPRRLDSG
jgi:hypothetical protein